MQRNDHSRRVSESGSVHPSDNQGALAVDVLMLAYNVGPYIEEAVEGVMLQQSEFPIRLVIAEDHSTDDTLKRCQEIARQYPSRIHLIRGEQNLGIAGRAEAGLTHCHARYLAICDGDDRWTDPFKLARQVEFLEMNKAYGLSYSDVLLISREGMVMDPDGYDPVRADYASGEVFPALLKGNFINNSTVLVRRALLLDHVIGTGRDHFVHDFLMWLHVSACSQVHFLPERTTAYRQGGVSSTDERASRNAMEVRSKLGTLLLRHATWHTTIPDPEKPFLFRRILGVLLRGGTDLRTKRDLLGKLHMYLPFSIIGWRNALRWRGRSIPGSKLNTSTK